MGYTVPTNDGRAAAGGGRVIDLYSAALWVGRRGQPHHGELPLSADEVAQVQRLVARMRERRARTQTPQEVCVGARRWGGPERRAPRGWARDRAWPHGDDPVGGAAPLIFGSDS